MEIPVSAPEAAAYWRSWLRKAKWSPKAASWRGWKRERRWLQSGEYWLPIVARSRGGSSRRAVGSVSKA